MFGREYNHLARHIVISMDRRDRFQRRTHLVIADRDAERSRSLSDVLRSIERPRSEIVQVSPDSLETIVPGNVEASDALVILLSIEHEDDVRTASEVKQLSPTRHVFVAGLVDPQADDLVRQAYNHGFNACIPRGPLDETVDRVRRAAQFALGTMTL